MVIFCCRISNLITFLLVIYFILIAVEPSTSDDRPTICLNKLHEAFRVFTAENHYDNNLTNLFKYAILNLRYVKYSEPHSIIRLLYDGNLKNRQNVYFDDEYSYAYYGMLANLFEKDTPQGSQEYIQNIGSTSQGDSEEGPQPRQTVRSAKAFCSDFPDTEKPYCEFSLMHFGFTAEDQEGIIRYAYTKIVLHDIESNTHFIDDMKWYAENYLKEIADRVYVIQNDENTPESFCSDIENRLSANK